MYLLKGILFGYFQTPMHKSTFEFSLGTIQLTSSPMTHQTMAKFCSMINIRTMCSALDLLDNQGPFRLKAQ